MCDGRKDREKNQACFSRFVWDEYTHVKKLKTRRSMEAKKEASVKDEPCRRACEAESRENSSRVASVSHSSTCDTSHTKET